MSFHRTAAFAAVLFGLFACADRLVAPLSAGSRRGSEVAAYSHVNVTPSEVTLTIGDSFRLKAVCANVTTGQYQSCRPKYTTTSRSVAAIAGNGIVTAKGVGKAYVIATDAGASDTCVVTVTTGQPADTTTTPTQPPDTTTPAPPPAPPPDSSFATIIAGIRPRGFGATAYALYEPAAGKRAYYVSPAGNDADSGTISLPFRTINRAAQLATAGDVVTIMDGTYAENVNVQNSGTNTARIVFQAEHRGNVILTGGQYTFKGAGFVGLRGATPQQWVTLHGLIVRAYAGNSSGRVAIRATKGWTLDDCWIDDAGESGVGISDDSVTIVRSTFSNNYLIALNAYPGYSGGSTPADSAYHPIYDFRLIDSKLYNNNPTNASLSLGLGASTGVAKIASGSVRTLIENVESYGNHGSGIWFDQKSIDFVIQFSYFHNQVAPDQTQPRGGRGINLEMAWGGGLVQYNVVKDNQGVGLSLVNVDSLEVKNNLFTGNRTSVELYNLTGANYALFTLTAIHLHHNFFRGWTYSPGAIWAVGGSFTMPATSAPLSLTIDYNTYQPVSQTALTGGWPAPLYGATTIAQMQSKFGFEIHGSLGTITW